MVVLILDFDSTITEESTLIQLYLRLPEEIFKSAMSISNKDYYDKELPLTKECYKRIKQIMYREENWEKCLEHITAIILEYSQEIEALEVKGMSLIEGPLKHLDVSSLERAASQIKVRSGFESLVKDFGGQVYILSCNWSTDLVKLVCPEIDRSKIISNNLRFKDGKCNGFERKRIVLTPEHKFKEFQRIKKDKNIVCGDSLPDLLLLLNADRGFAFVSHDKDFIEVCLLSKTKFLREIHIVDNFEEVRSILGNR